MSLLVYDGAYDQVGGLAVNPPEIEYPFEQNGDMWSLILTQTYKQTPDAWIADQVAARYVPGVKELAHATYGTLYLMATSKPTSTPTGLYVFTRSWARVPRQQIIQGSYLFSAPNFTPINWSSAFTTVPSGSYAIEGNYAIIALASYTPAVNALTTAACAALSGYFGAALAITAYTGDPATTLTIPGHNYIADNHILYRRDSGNQRFYTFAVSSISGNDVIGTSTVRAEFSAAGSAVALYLLPLAFTTTALARKRTKTAPDTGQQVVLPAQTIDDYYLLGVSSGIAVATDILHKQPYTLESYLAAWAAAAAWFNVQSSGLDPWLDGPILKRSYTQARLNP